MINSNVAISHRFRDMATYWLKITNFSYPLSHLATLIKVTLLEFPKKR